MIRKSLFRFSHRELKIALPNGIERLEVADIFSDPDVLDRHA